MNPALSMQAAGCRSTWRHWCALQLWVSWSQVASKDCQSYRVSMHQRNAALHSPRYTKCPTCALHIVIPVVVANLMSKKCRKYAAVQSINQWLVIVSYSIKNAAWSPLGVGNCIQVGYLLYINRGTNGARKHPHDKVLTSSSKIWSLCSHQMATFIFCIFMLCFVVYCLCVVFLVHCEITSS